MIAAASATPSISIQATAAAARGGRIAASVVKWLMRSDRKGIEPLSGGVREYIAYYAVSTSGSSTHNIST